MDSDPNEVAEWLYYTTSAFSGRDGKCRAGGGHGDIRALVAAASGINIIYDENVRKIKIKLRNRLMEAWQGNDHAEIMYIARGFERGASMAPVDISSVLLANQSTESDDEFIEIPVAIEDWIETFFEFMQIKPTVGNCIVKKFDHNKSIRITSSLFEEV